MLSMKVLKSTNTKICTVGWPHFKDSWYCYPQESNGRMFEGRKPLRKQRGRWEDAVWRKEIWEAMSQKWAEAP